MAWPLRFLAISLVLTVALVAVGTFLRTPHHDTAAPPTSGVTPLPDSLASVDTTTMSVQRAPFCDRLAADDLAKALGGAVLHATSYGPGGTDDEYGCQWRSAHRTARAWVFAPPVAPAWAHQLAGTTPSGCHPLADLPYGAPSTALRCGAAIRLAGLFGDAWLTCSLETADADLAGRFCLAVARATA